MELTDINTWLEPFGGLWQDLAPVLPRMVASVALMGIGLLVSAGLRATIEKGLVAFGVDERVEGFWIFKLWSRSRHGQKPSHGLASLVFYGGVFITTFLTIRTLGMGAHSGVFAALLDVGPRILSVVLILLLSGLLANFVSLFVQIFMTSSRLHHSNFWGKVAAWTTFGAGVMFSLEPLGLAGQLLGNAVLILLGALGLALGLAFGLGCKDLAREFLLELFNDDKGA